MARGLEAVVKDPLQETPVEDRNLAAVLARHVRERPDHVAVIEDGGGSLTYAALQVEAFRMAAGLAELGVERQEPVLVLLDNHLDNVLVIVGSHVGATILAPINTAFRGEILRHVIANSGAKVAIVEGSYCDRIAAVIDDVPCLKTVIVRGEPIVDLPSRIQVRPFSDLLGSEPTEPAEPGQTWDIAGLLYTSGTTGPSKGVLCPHGLAFSMASGPLVITGDDVVMVTLPLFHGAGLWNETYGALRAGATAVILPTFSATRFLDDARRLGVTTTLLLGAMAAFLSGQPPTPDDAANPLRRIVVVPAPPGLDAFSERFGVECISSYGLTEAGVAFATEPGDARPFVVGRPRAHIEVRLVDAHDVDVAPGEAGEIVLRSTEPWAMMAGYHAMPEATVAVYKNLWFHTGDAAYQDQTGNFVFVDRTKDALRRRGENVSSIEVEQVILARPEIAQAAIVAVPSEYGEDDIKAVVVIEAGHLFDPRALVRDLADRLPYFMVPRYYEVIEEMPMTMTHKIQKAELRKSGITEATWDCEAAGLRVTRDGLWEEQPR